MNTKKLFTIFSIMTMATLVLAPVAAMAAAEEPGALLEEIGRPEQTGLGGEGDGQSQLVRIVSTIINVLLSLLGVILLLLIIYGGVLWMTARGNEDQVKKAKNILTDAIIGLIIILAAYAISTFVVNALVEATLE